VSELIHNSSNFQNLEFARVSVFFQSIRDVLVRRHPPFRSTAPSGHRGNPTPQPRLADAFNTVCWWWLVSESILTHEMAF
jgi:hypothetical protein